MTRKRTGYSRDFEAVYLNGRQMSVKTTRSTSLIRAIQRAVLHLAQDDYGASKVIVRHAHLEQLPLAACTRKGMIISINISRRM